MRILLAVILLALFPVTSSAENKEKIAITRSKLADNKCIHVINKPTLGKCERIPKLEYKKNNNGQGFIFVSLKLADPENIAPDATSSCNRIVWYADEHKMTSYVQTILGYDSYLWHKTEIPKLRVESCDAYNPIEVEGGLLIKDLIIRGKE